MFNILTYVHINIHILYTITIYSQQALPNTQTPRLIHEYITIKNTHSYTNKVIDLHTSFDHTKFYHNIYKSSNIHIQHTIAVHTQRSYIRIAYEYLIYYIHHYQAYT